ncbi:MAG: PP2C family protein-serine/threonine phosphatase [Paracoccaceae bacterium]
MSELRTAWIATDVGVVRPRNEDRCFAGPWVAEGTDGAWTVELDGDRWAAAVADGMGGHQAGEFASETVIAELIAMADEICSESSASAALDYVNQMVFQAMYAPRGVVGMGSTVVGVSFLDGDAIIFNVGDSRAYIVRETGLVQVSVDHTLGLSSSHSARSHRLTQSLGGTTRRTTLHPSVQKVKLSPNDQILLCSDGLTDMIGDGEIMELLFSNSAHPAQALVAAATIAGARDNVTAIVVGCLVEG